MFGGAPLHTLVIRHIARVERVEKCNIAVSVGKLLIVAVFRWLSIDCSGFPLPFIL